MADPATGDTTTPTGAATPSPYPQGGATTPTTDFSPNLNWGAGSGNGNWLSNIGSDLSNAVTTAGNWIQSPAGQLTASAVPIGAALYQAGRATTNANNLTNSITAAARPQLNLGSDTISQLRGGPSVGGPMGQYVTGATGAANELATTAQQYGTGNLTPAQQQMVTNFATGQKGQVASQLARTGTLDSSTRASLNQSVDNNTAMLSQALENQNIQIAAGALQAVNSTYSTLLSNALNQSWLGTQATSQAVQQQLAANDKVQQLLQQIMAGMASGLTTAQGGQVSKQGGQTPGAQMGESAIAALKKYLGGGGGTTGTDTTAAGQQAQSAIDQSLGQTTPGLTDITSMQMPNFNIDTGNPDPSTMGLGGEGW